MVQKIKAAWIALSIIILLTSIKFALYWISGSIAVLSEAWHSISDIGTTALVVFSIALQNRKEVSSDLSPVSVHEENKAGVDVDSERSGWLRSFYSWERSVNTELKLAVFIGLVLMAAAVTIFWRGIKADQTEVSAPFVTGCIFIVLSFGSYFLCLFEEHIGRLENSPALTADSQHNRADMAISLLTGVSLLLYHFGYNLDRLVGLLIAAYIFTFSIELLVNAIRSVALGRGELVSDYRFTSIIWRAFQLETYRQLFIKVDKQLQFGESVKRVIRKIPVILKWLLVGGGGVAVAAGVLVYGSTMFYTVDRDERALLFRFGKIVNTEEAISPGLHMKFPWPIDNVVRIKTEAIQSLIVGNEMAKEAAMIWSKEHGDNRMFISADNNLFLPYIAIHYRVKDSHGLYLTYTDGAPVKILSSLALQLLNHLFSQTQFYDLILAKRNTWTGNFQDFLQKQCDQLEIGVEIVQVCLRDLHPPIELAGAYEEVVAAGQLKVAHLNDAERKVDALLSRQRIAKLRTITEAESYVVEKKMQAEGEAANYLLRHQGYTEGGNVMKEILFFKAAAETLSKKKIYLLDPDSGIDEKLLYIEKYMTGK